MIKVLWFPLYSNKSYFLITSFSTSLARPCYVPGPRALHGARTLGVKDPGTLLLKSLVARHRTINTDNKQIDAAGWGQLQWRRHLGRGRTCSKAQTQKWPSNSQGPASRLLPAEGEVMRGRDGQSKRSWFGQQTVMGL